MDCPIDSKKRAELPVDEQKDYDLFCERGSVFLNLYRRRVKQIME
jgi:hypothetical protein